MNRPLLTLLAFHALDKLLFFSTTPNKPISAWQAGWLDDSGLALFFVVQIFCYRLFPLLGGFLADRHSKRATLAFGSLLQALGLAALCQANSPLALFGAGGLVGIGGGILNPAIYSMLSQVSGPAGSRAFSTHYLLINVGALAGPLLMWPSFGNACLWLLLPAGVALAGVLATPEGSRAMPAQHQSASWFAPLHDPIFLRVFILFSAIWACYTMIFSSAPLIAAELGLRTRGNVWLGVNSATVLLAYLWTLRRPPKAGISWPGVSAGLALTVAGVALVGAAPTGLLVGAGIAVLSIGELMSIPVLYHLVSEHAPAHARSRYFGFIWVAGAIGEAGAQALLWACPQPRIICIVAAAILALATLSTRKIKVRAAEINASENVAPSIS
ncbi:MFS transporter [Burkholderia ubonensis]|uniref:MFS transporter n=1 Tax=Burkholderia ubonensis TaxID=101571 RepID=UPI000F5693EE|nr:MFS transporter [Burkholderia ubonensis]RQP32378.1 MFS transporter [Burkholderia ubonensis]RQP32503.1 MFS transporter [Burkholderia ubonensis]RQP46508.1 MFS transporter [Burkholderia ubonensis]RQP50637.1 MFS transporter [Burkholderia ubonensis]RQP58110.1 MFS transporter [Burkholderia ubonensis]